MAFSRVESLRCRWGVHAVNLILGKQIKVLCDGQVDVAALPVYRCLSIGEAGGGVRAIRGSFGQGHSGVPGRCGEWLAANSEYVGRGQPLARLISSARVTQNATALFRAILGYREGTPWRNFEDGVEHSQIAIARLNDWRALMQP